MLGVLLLVVSGCWDIYLHHQFQVGRFGTSATMEIAPMPVCIESVDCTAKPYRPQH